LQNIINLTKSITYLAQLVFRA